MEELEGKAIRQVDFSLRKRGGSLMLSDQRFDVLQEQHATCTILKAQIDHKRKHLPLAWFPPLTRDLLLAPHRFKPICMPVPTTRAPKAPTPLPEAAELADEDLAEAL